MHTFCWRVDIFSLCSGLSFGPRQANLVLIAYASSEGSGEPAHPRSLARTFAARLYKQWVKRNLQTESQFPSPSEWLGMRSWNLSWRNARRHKFAWRGSFDVHNVLVMVTSSFSDLRSKTIFDVSQWISLCRMLKSLLAYILCYHDPIHLLAAEEM